MPEAITARARAIAWRLMPADLRERLARSALSRKPRPNWWLVYGTTRSGTTYMHDLILLCARLSLGDWGLGPILAAAYRWQRFRSYAEHNYIRFDGRRLLADLSTNILDSAYPGFGSQIDLVYKQATLAPDEYPGLVALWGPPARAVCCLREPAGYLASAARQFPTASVEDLQQAYVQGLSEHAQAGGDVFEYRPDLTAADYVEFLKPLSFEGRRVPEFRYQGSQDLEHVTDEMWQAYYRVKASAPAGAGS